MLRLMLTCHRNIVIPPECGFAVWLEESYGHRKGPFDEPVVNEMVQAIGRCKKFDTWQVDLVALKSQIVKLQPTNWSDLCSCVYEEYGRQRGELFTRWGDKNNFYLRHIHTIRRLYPACYFVHIVRDGRNVACSYRRLNERQMDGRYAPELPDDIDEIATSWQNNVSHARQSFEEFEWHNTLELRLEDLTREPQSELLRLCTWLGEEFDENMLEFHDWNRTNQLEPAEMLPWKERTLQPVSGRQNDEFRTSLTVSEQDRFQSIAGEMLSIYGYG